MQHATQEVTVRTGRSSYAKRVARGVLRFFGPRYPKWYAKSTYTRDGLHILLRPIKPQDAARLTEFFGTLSKKTIHYRFLADVKSLPQEWIDHFTIIDYSRDIAVVATRGYGSEEKLIGVCRIMRNAQFGKGEVAIVVGDSWQGRGIGRKLLRHCIFIAKDMGIKALWGLVSLDNDRALYLAEKFGFTKIPDFGTDTFELHLDMRSRPQKSDAHGG